MVSVSLIFAIHKRARPTGTGGENWGQKTTNFIRLWAWKKVHLQTLEKWLDQGSERWSVPIIIGSDACPSTGRQQECNRSKKAGTKQTFSNT